MANDEDMHDPDLKAAIAASLQSPEGSGDANDSAHGESPKGVVDLTADSDDEVVEVYPKSKSVVESESDDEEVEDDELRRAIMLSMRATEEIDSSDDGYAELERAILISMQDEPKNGGDASKPETSGGEEDDNMALPSRAKEESTSKPEPSQAMPLSGLDRKQMEQERLARLAKRKAEETPTNQPEAKQARTETLPGGVRGSKSSPRSPRKGKVVSSDGKSKSQSDKPSTTPSVQFPAGVVKKTWNQHCPRNEDDIKIEEVFQASDLELAVLSSFMWEMEWIFSKMDTKSTRFLLIMQAKEESTRRQYESETAMMKNIRLCFPPMEGQVNCMHSKLMLLFHRDYVRIAIPTANLTPFDWGCVGGALENSVFLIDLPRKTAGSGASKMPFYEELVYFLKASTVNENIIAKLDSFDFSQTTHIAFVHTIGGSHGGDSWQRTGYCGLGRAVDSLGLRTSTPLNIDYITSSVGSLKDEFLQSIYLAAQGDSGLTEYTHRTRTKTQPKPELPIIQGPEHNRFRVYFPSQTTVESSPGGPNSAGTICFQSSWYENAKFPRRVLRDCQSIRGLLMHNKIIYIRPDTPVQTSLPGRDDKNTTCPAWAYIGSANLSESAWGRLVQDRATKSPKLNCRNWECGVVIPVLEAEPSTSTNESKSKGKEPASIPGRKVSESESESERALDVFHGTIPVPMVIPGRKYEGGSLRPWYFLEG